jgi:hypothetical protein
MCGVANSRLINYTSILSARAVLTAVTRQMMAGQKEYFTTRANQRVTFQSYWSTARLERQEALPPVSTARSHHGGGLPVSVEVAWAPHRINYAKIVKP